MSVIDCDACSEPVTSPGDWRYIMLSRPSDPSEFCCVMAGHKRCFPGGWSHQQLAALEDDQHEMARRRLAFLSY